MNCNPERRGAALKEILLEGLAVAMLGALFAFSVNWLAVRLTLRSSSPLGLELSRDYFPEGRRVSTTSQNATPLGVHPAATATNSNLELLAARLRDKGLRLADSNQVAQLFHDPRAPLNLVVFVDARQPEAYREGHIPGAYLFDHYHPETYFGSVLPACRIAQEIVVYCHGGDCEDSEFAATMLRDFGIPAEKLLVYGNGITEWMTNGMPVEVGERQSGQMRPTPK